MGSIDAHRRHAVAVRSAATGDGGVTAAALRSGILERGGGGAPVTEPHDALVRQIDEAAHRVTDAQVAATRDAAGSDKGAFEIIICASTGAGLARWDAALRAIEEASDAPG